MAHEGWLFGVVAEPKGQNLGLTMNDDRLPPAVGWALVHQHHVTHRYTLPATGKSRDDRRDTRHLVAALVSTVLGRLLNLVNLTAVAGRLRHRHQLVV